MLPVGQVPGLLPSQSFPSISYKGIIFLVACHACPSFVMGLSEEQVECGCVEGGVSVDVRKPWAPAGSSGLREGMG